MFSGYKSPLDIYTFQVEFEKLYSRRITSALLPEYLKHNFLEGTALDLVKTMTDINLIWSRLKEAFGDTRLLLHNKLKEVDRFGEIWKIRDRSKLIDALAKLVFVMKELKELAVKHSIENNLYYGGAIETMYKVIGYRDRDEFVRKYIRAKLSEESKWEKLTEFLQEKLSLAQELLLLDRPNSPAREKRDSKEKEDRSHSVHHNSGSNVACYICGESGHLMTRNFKGKSVVQYFSCQKFVEMSAAEMFKVLREKNLCIQCLAPGAPADTSRHKADCFSKYCCKHKSHDRHVKRKHVLVCEEHKSSADNKAILEEYKKNCILNLKENIPDFSKQLSFHSEPEQLVEHEQVVELEETVESSSPELVQPFEQQVEQMSTSEENDESVALACRSKNHFDQPDVKESSSYILQTIDIDGEKFNIFFDNGCREFCARIEAIEKLMKLGRARLVKSGPTTLIGVCDQKSVSEHGIYEVSLPMFDGKNAVMSGIVVDQVTGEFPRYRLGNVERDIHEEFRSAGCQSLRSLPSLPSEVGGETDIMIGSQYFVYSPKLIFECQSGLRLLESVFCSPDGTRGTVGGPHPEFTEADRKWSQINVNFEKLIKNIQCYRLSIDLPFLGVKDPKDYFQENLVVCPARTKEDRASSTFESIETAGTECTYRCVDCRSCVKCKKSKQVEHMTIREEVEQNLIEKSVEVNIGSSERTVAGLPFISDPTVRLKPSNKANVLKIYKSVLRSLDKSPSSKKDVIAAEQKLQDAGFVDYLDNLSDEQQQKILTSPVKYFLVWRPAYSSNSVSTSVRLVMDASFSLKGEYSLNDLLAKGRNGMNKLVEIAIRWCIHRFAYHTDISKMYPSIRLKEEFWNYQLYLWQRDLDIDEDPVIKVIKTVIYGFRSSGNQAEYAIRETARQCAVDYPRAAEVIHDDTYVDDCASGEDDWESTLSTANDIDVVLKKGNFSLKGVTFSGYDPPSNLANDDQVSVNVLGLQWFSKEDKISLNASEMNFGRKQRGRRPPELKNVIPEDFTRRQCVGKVAEVHDILGKVSPIIGGFKIDLRELTSRKLDWDDKIPNELQALWVSNFEMMKDISNIRYNRAVIPEDAVSLDIDTIDAGDASRVLACVAIYARFKRSCGNYSCQLIFSRTKLVPENMSQPRAELFAAALNASAGHVVALSLGEFHKGCLKLTDSQVALHWISNDNRVLKQWTRNQVIEIIRLAPAVDWRYVHTSNMVADIGTRKGVSLEEVGCESVWINGFDWMKKDQVEFPVMTVDEVKLDSSCLSDLSKEYLKGDAGDIVWSDMLKSKIEAATHHAKGLSNGLEDRYQFSKYVIDPNKFRFRKVVRVLALVMLFVEKLLKCVETKRSQQPKSIPTVHNHVCNLGDLFVEGKYLVTTGRSYKVSKSTSIQCSPGLVVVLSDAEINRALDYFYKKATLEVQKFLSKSVFEKISVERDGILYYSGRILPTQSITGKMELSNVMLDLADSTFCVPLTDRSSPLAYSIVNEVHWYEECAMHSGAETV